MNVLCGWLESEQGTPIALGYDDRVEMAVCMLMGGEVIVQVNSGNCFTRSQPPVRGATLLFASTTLSRAEQSSAK